MAEGGFGHGCAGDHAGDFFGAFLRGEEADGGLGAALLLLLLDEKVLIGEGGDLREVGDAEDLLDAREGFELLADGFGGAATDADVDFVKDEGAGDLSFAGAATVRALFDADFEGEEDAGHFAAGSDLVEGLDGLAWIGGDAALDCVPTVRGPGGGGFIGGDGDGEAGLHGEVVDLRFGELLEFLCSGGAVRGDGASGCLIRSIRLFEVRTKCFEDCVAIFDFGELARGFVAEGDDFGEGRTVFALEAIEEGEAIFDVGEALG